MLHLLRRAICASQRFYLQIQRHTHTDISSEIREYRRKLPSGISEFLSADDYISHGRRSSFSDLFSCKMKGSVCGGHRVSRGEGSALESLEVSTSRPPTRKSISTASRINLASHLKRPITSARGVRCSSIWEKSSPRKSSCGTREQPRRREARGTIPSPEIARLDERLGILVPDRWTGHRTNFLSRKKYVVNITQNSKYRFYNIWKIICASKI